MPYTIVVNRVALRRETVELLVNATSRGEALDFAEAFGDGENVPYPAIQSFIVTASEPVEFEVEAVEVTKEPLKRA